ncbi:MAG: hypothetical protein HY722_16520 [Planctomycetes bacterium]|nr:hypothetical protein [Planctomycetota bacterium]
MRCSLPPSLSLTLAVLATAGCTASAPRRGLSSQDTRQVRDLAELLALASGRPGGSTVAGVDQRLTTLLAHVARADARRDLRPAEAAAAMAFASAVARSETDTALRHGIRVAMADLLEGCEGAPRPRGLRAVEREAMDGVALELVPWGTAGAGTLREAITGGLAALVAGLAPAGEARPLRGVEALELELLAETVARTAGGAGPAAAVGPAAAGPRGAADGPLHSPLSRLFEGLALSPVARDPSPDEVGQTVGLASLALRGPGVEAVARRRQAAEAALRLVVLHRRAEGPRTLDGVAQGRVLEASLAVAARHGPEALAERAREIEEVLSGLLMGLQVAGPLDALAEGAEAARGLALRELASLLESRGPREGGGDKVVARDLLLEARSRRLGRTAAELRQEAVQLTSVLAEALRVPSAVPGVGRAFEEAGDAVGPDTRELAEAVEGLPPGLGLERTEAQARLIAGARRAAALEAARRPPEHLLRPPALAAPLWTSGNNFLHELVLIPPLESHETLPRGRFRGEVGYESVFQKGDIKNTSGEFIWTLNEMDLGLGYGLTPNDEVRAGLSGGVFGTAGNLVITSGGRNVFAEDLSSELSLSHAILGYKRRVFEPDERDPLGVSILATGKVPVAGKEHFLTTGSSDLAVVVAITNRLDALETSLNGGTVLVGGESLFERGNITLKNMTVAGASVGCPLTDFLAAVVQVQTNSSAFGRSVDIAGSSPATGHAGLRLLVRDLHAEGSLGMGLNGTSSDNIVGVRMGVTF